MAILYIGFSTRDCFEIICIYQNDIYARLRHDIVNWDPIYSGRFHCYTPDTVLLDPAQHVLEKYCNNYWNYVKDFADLYKKEEARIGREYPGLKFSPAYFPAFFARVMPTGLPGTQKSSFTPAVTIMHKSDLCNFKPDWDSKRYEPAARYTQKNQALILRDKNTGQEHLGSVRK